MTRSVRALALAMALATTLPTVGCAATGYTPRIENPVAAAKTLDQRAHAALQSYGAVLESAAELVADPRTPGAVKQALRSAEAATTPSVETLEIGLSSYLRAQARYQVLAGGDASQTQKAAAALASAAAELGTALQRAEAPMAELKLLIAKR
jgi:hypothetical protein